MRFQVPQFIDVEDKLFGPLSFRQFAYLTGGAGLCYVVYQTLPTLIAYVLMLALAAFAIALAFVKVNEKPFIDIVEAAFKFVLRGKLYLWKREKPEKKEIEEVHEKARAYVPRLTESKLHDISWGLDVLNNRLKDRV